MFASIISRSTKSLRRAEESGGNLTLNTANSRVARYVNRHAKDSQYIIKTYDPNEPTPRIKQDDTLLDIRFSPSYSKFKVPL